MALNVLSIGASRNIGYFTALYLLGEGHRVTFLLRKPSAFDKDSRIQEYVQSGHAKLVAGDALSSEDLKKAWAAAAEHGQVDYVVYTVGMTPKFTLTGGLQFDNRTICSSSMHTLLSAWPNANTEGTSPTKLIVISSNGITPKSHDSQPWLLRSFYGLTLNVPHVDKRAMEQFIAYSAANSESFECNPEEVAKLEKSGHLFANWQKTLKKGNWLEVCLLRPSLYTTGESKCESKGVGALRIGPEDLSSPWFISRKDIAWLIAKKITKEWDDWKGKAVTLSY